MDLFDLYAKITLDDSEYKKGMSSAKTEGAGLSSSLMKNMKAGVGAIAAFGTAAIALGGMFVKAALSVSDYGSTVNDMSQRLGISAKGYQQWDYILGQSGGNIESLQIGMKTLSEAVVSGSDAFGKIGLKMKDVKKMSQEELFNATITQLAGMEAGAERTSLANDLFGKSAIGLMPILNEGADGIEKMKKQAEDYGLIMSDSAVAASDAFGDSVSLMQQTLTGMKNRMISEFLPALTQVTDGLALLFTGDTSGLDGINSGLGEFVNKISEAIPQIMTVGGSILQALASAIMSNMPLLVTSAFDIISQLAMFLVENLPMIVDTAMQILLSLVSGLSESMPVLIPAVIEAVLTIVDGLLNNVPLLLDAAIQLMIGIATGLINAIPTLIQMVPQILSSLVAALINEASALLEAGPEFISSIEQGITDAASGIKAFFSTFAQEKLLQPIKDSVEKFKNIGKDIATGIWNGISEKYEWIKGKIRTWVGNVISFIKNLFGIHSPSTVMRDEVGAFIPAGLAAGIDKKRSLVQTAMEGIRDMVATGIPVNVTSGGFTPGARGIQLYGGINFYEPTQSPIQTADRIARELTGMLYA